MTGDARRWIERFRLARKDKGLAVLEGLHALKHARRFGAEVTCVLTLQGGPAAMLAAALAPELVPFLADRGIPVEPAIFEGLAPTPHKTGVIALARRPAASLPPAPRGAPAILLDRPRNLGNAGAVIRVAAAAGCSAVMTRGDLDPWHPTVLRAAAGLHFALPVLALAPDAPLPTPLLAVDAAGDVMPAGGLPADAVLAFGSERSGLDPAILAAAAGRIALPMREGVSSLNLATAAAAMLYAGFVMPAAGGGKG